MSPLAKCWFNVYRLRRIVFVLLLVVGSGFLIRGINYVLFSTPVPVYILDKMNLRRFSLPDLVCNKCNNFTYSYLVENKNFCANEDIFLLIFVTSFHTNVAARNMMRKTWGAMKEYRGYRIKLIFVFGTHPDKNLNGQAKYEQERYGDILQANFSDHYHFLTNKTSSTLRWVTENCPHAKYVLKTDDDSFNIPQNFVDYLIHVKEEKFIGGYCFTVTPDRRLSSKFYVPEELYPDKYYPTYCAGPGYILSQGAVRDIVAVLENTNFIPMEDVFITGMCRVVAGLQYTEISGVVVGHDQMTPCNMARWVKNGHNIVPGQTEMFWNRLKEVDKTVDCAERNIFIYVILLIFIVAWARLLFSLYSPYSVSKWRNIVSIPCLLTR